MRNKTLLKRLICLLSVILLAVVSVTVSAEDNDAVSEAKSLIDGIVDYKLEEAGAGSIQEWIDGKLTENAGVLSEWYILTLSQSGKYDFKSYEAALKQYIDSNEISSVVTVQKYALALAASGSDDRYISDLFNDSIGKMGIMSWVFGLHILNNGYTSSEYMVSDVIEEILVLQLEDGGWAINGQYGDVDTTAMVIQALAPYYESDLNVRNAVDTALEMLASKQLDDGGYLSYGVPNPESASQVIVALSSLGIDISSDERFIKNGRTLIDAVSDYRLPDGSFCHKEGGDSNETATIQVFYALTSYVRMVEGKSPFYILDKVNNGDDESIEESVITGNTDDSENITDTLNEDSGGSYKLPVCIGIIGAGVIVSVIFYILRKRHRNNFIFIWLAVAALVGFVCISDFKSAEDYYNGQPAVKEEPVGTVTLAIRCDTVLGKSSGEYIPEDGIILDVTEFQIEDGDTVYDILCEAARRYDIQMESSGSGKMAYISGINYIYEFDFGELSGWMYFVNGSEPSVGCGGYNLSDGDVIEWHYTCSLGEDLR